VQRHARAARRPNTESPAEHSVSNAEDLPAAPGAGGRRTGAIACRAARSSAVEGAAATAAHRHRICPAMPDAAIGAAAHLAGAANDALRLLRGGRRRSRVPQSSILGIRARPGRPASSQHPGLAGADAACALLEASLTLATRAPEPAVAGGRPARPAAAGARRGQLGPARSPRPPAAFPRPRRGLPTQRAPAGACRQEPLVGRRGLAQAMSRARCTCNAARSHSGPIRSTASSIV
jgi:hypothetical protein